MQTSADIYTDFSHLAELKRKSKQGGDAALKEVAKQFEAMFLQMVLKQMRQASPGDPIFDNDRSRFYQEMHDQQLALHLSEGGSIGIADLIVRQLGGQTESQAKPRPLSDYRSSTKVSQPASPDISPKVTTRTDKTASSLPPSAQHQGPAMGTGNFAIQQAATKNASAPSGNSVNSKSAAQFEGPQHFVRTLLPEAQQAASRIGIDPKLLLAQAALETGWGKKIILHPDGRSSHNLFNIKAGRHWEAERVKVSTLEYMDGIAVRRHADFRSYEDYRQSFEDYAKLIQKPRYAEALHHSDDPEKYLKALQQAGYATDPDYADKILAIYRRQNLAALTR